MTLCYVTKLLDSEEQPDLFYNFVTTRVNITVDIRTAVSRTRSCGKMEDEFRRLIHTKRKGDGVNYDRLIIKTRTDLVTEPSVCLDIPSKSR